MTKILIVDDERACRESLRLLLSLENFDVETAADGREALQIGSSFTPDVLIVDWLLGERRDGLKLAEAIRQLNPNVEAIVVSGYLSDDLEAEIERLPSTQYLAKPFRPEELMAAVGRAAERSGGDSV